VVLVVAEGGYVAEEGGSAVAEEGEGRDWHYGIGGVSYT
jgi:hypothetical protein